MRLATFIAGLSALTAATVALVVVPAFAQSTQRGTAPTQVIVTKKQKSYLDPGTVVKQDGRGYNNYVMNFQGRPNVAYDPTGSQSYGLPGRFSLPGF
jgi:hypothetical protein